MALLWKMICNLGDPMSLRHPLCEMTHRVDNYVWHDSYCVTWLIYMWHDSYICDMTHIYVTWLIYRWHDSFILSTLIYDLAHSSCWHLYVTWRIAPERHVTHIKDSVCHDSFVCVTWLLFDTLICDMTHCAWAACHTCEGVLSRV